MAKRSRDREEDIVVKKYFQKEKDEMQAIRPPPVAPEMATTADLNFLTLEQLADAIRAYTEHRATPEQIRYLKKHGRID